ncbi:MAG TPA: GNAT family N-acetyltransferase [Dehalococcoidia bacterium]|nr:GNAT family N-acetyltransferase [Dehalococcoidia bacterium]
MERGPGGEATPLTLRPCRIEDIPAVLALWQRAGAVPRPTDHAAALRLRLERDAELFLLALDGDRLAGSLLGGWDGWRGNMYRLAVDPDYRRTGVARRLVLAVESALRAKGAERITSLVFEAEPGAAAFWRNAGYAPDPATRRYAKDLPQRTDPT